MCLPVVCDYALTYWQVGGAEIEEEEETVIFISATRIKLRPCYE